MAVLFAVCGCICVEMAISYVGSLSPGADPPWLIWMVYFPAAICLAIGIAIVLGLSQNVRAASVWSFWPTSRRLLGFMLFVFLWYLALVPALLVNAFFLALAQSLLTAQVEMPGVPIKKRSCSSSCFF